MDHTATVKVGPPTEQRLHCQFSSCKGCLGYESNPTGKLELIKISHSLKTLLAPSYHTRARRFSRRCPIVSFVRHSPRRGVHLPLT